MLQRFGSLARSCWRDPLIALLLSFVLAFTGCDAGSALPDAGAPSAATAPAATSIAPSVAIPPASATASTSASAAPEPPVVTAQPFLWQVKKDGADPAMASSYLFGTMHIGTDAETELHPFVFQRLDAARAVFFEANVFDIDVMEVAAKAMLPPGQSMKSKLSPGRWEILVDRLGGLLTPEATLDRLKPWALAGMLAQDMLPSTQPMDKVMYERAKAANKKLLFLETVDQQLTSIEASLDAKVLDDMLGDMPLAEKTILELADAYRKGDMERLMKVTFDPEEMKKHPAMFDKLLYARNRNWIPKLIAELDRGGVFVAVGAAHLLGDKSVNALLAEKGYSLSRMAVR
jgi:hypothetical protein